MRSKIIQVGVKFGAIIDYIVWQGDGDEPARHIAGAGFGIVGLLDVNDKIVTVTVYTVQVITVGTAGGGQINEDKGIILKKRAVVF